MKALLLAPFCFAVLGAISAAESAPPARPWLLWDGQETVEAYAQRVNLTPTKTLDLGDDVKLELELVLIPAGRFVMGTPEPAPVDEEAFRPPILIGQAILAASGGVLLVLLGAVALEAIRKRSRPKFSLARLLAMSITAGAAVLSGEHWRQAAESRESARIEYQAAKARFGLGYVRETPAHPVTLTRPFYMGKYEVTQEQYRRITGAGITKVSGFSGPNLPMHFLSWDHAQKYCAKLSDLAKQPVRLPTEAEWEWGCRAGTKTSFYCGDYKTDVTRAGWCTLNSKKPCPVGQKQPNAFGLYDMHGNVCEWCQDWFDVDYYATSPAIDPPGPSRGTARVYRGGSFHDRDYGCRSAARASSLPGIEQYLVGLRVVMDVPSAP